MFEDNNGLYNKKMELSSKIENLKKNTKYLEEKVSTLMTQKEEQIIKLKSEIVIYKNKIQVYKQKLKSEISSYETKKIQEYKLKLE